MNTTYCRVCRTLRARAAGTVYVLGFLGPNPDERGLCLPLECGHRMHTSGLFENRIIPPAEVRRCDCTEREPFQHHGIPTHYGA